MLKRILSTSFFGLFLIGMVSTASAQVKQDLKIGYVDPQAILTKMTEMKAVQQRLQNFMEDKRNELAQKRQDYQQQISEYQEKEAVLSDDAKKKEEERLGELGADLQEYQTQLQQEVQEKQQELVGPLLDQIDQAIATVAEDMNLSYVLNTTTSNGDVIILYVSDEAQQKYDITEKVQNELNV